MPAVVASLDPTALPVGPPADARLYVYGTGFEPDSQIRFGAVLERTDYHSATVVSTIISQGIFPNQDPAIPVSVYNADGTESNVVTFAFVVIPTMPAAGAVVADLDTLKAYVGARTSQDDIILQQRLDSAVEYVYERCSPHHWGHPNVQEACLLLASRLYKRRQSPEGITGFGGDGGAIRIIAGDPDINDLIERHLDYTTAGLA